MRCVVLAACPLTYLVDISEELQFVNWIQIRLFCSLFRGPKAYKVISSYVHCCDYRYFGIWIDILLQNLTPTYSWQPRTESTQFKIRTVGFEINDTRCCQGYVFIAICHAIQVLDFNLSFRLQKKMSGKSCSICSQKYLDLVSRRCYNLSPIPFDLDVFIHR